jgi:hypothetical protein
MSNSLKSIILFVLALSLFSFLLPTGVTQSFAQNSERISIALGNSSFVPLTNTDANQVRVGVEYTIEDETIQNEMINAVMKVYAENGSLIRTTSLPSGFTAQVNSKYTGKHNFHRFDKESTCIKCAYSES